MTCMADREIVHRRCVEIIIDAYIDTGCPPSNTAIAEALGIARHWVTRVMRGVEIRGWVVDGAACGRRVITPEGLAQLDAERLERYADAHIERAQLAMAAADTATRAAIGPDHPALPTSERPKPEVARRLAKARRDRGWSRNRLAALVGVTVGTVRLWESGASQPQRSYARWVASVMPEVADVLDLGRPARGRFGRRLRQVRDRARLTPDGVARQIGVHRETLRSWESFGRLPRDEDVVKRLEAAVGAPLLNEWAAARGAS